MNFDQYILYRALNTKAHLEGEAFNSETKDRFLEKEVEKQSLEFKTVCAPISIELFTRLSTTLNLLDISKRTFIEAALIEALNKADVIINEVDVFERAVKEEE
jgi:hypothetical protein